MGETVTIQAVDGHELSAYVARPLEDPIAGLVVIQEIFGVNRHIRSIADGYAKDGFLAVAPALFDRVEKGVELSYEGEDGKKGMALLQKMDIVKALADVDAALAQPGTTMVVVNSICGCAAGKMRPGVRLAMQHAAKPDHAVTVFAGQDREATEKARSYFGGHPPTSPAIAILRDGQLVYLMQRSAIETSTAPAIAQELARAFDTYCAPTTA